MKFAGAGFERHSDGAGRSQAVVGTIVRGQLTELSNGLAGRGNGHAATATAVVVLTAVEHESVVGGALAVEADGGIAPHRNVLVIGDIVRCAGSQGSKLEQAGAIDRELRYLVAGYQVALLAGICLNADGGRFYGNALRRRAHLHLEVDARAVAHLEHNALLFRELEPRRFGLHVILAYANAW